ncbi:hypothetical protein J4410_04890 [Candidatus Woesearchaeota archaeon]|nr:hypothetical protein [Candidatus Woesearchaeota archaeon]
MEFDTALFVNIIGIIIPMIILIPLSALLLMASTRMFKTKDQRYSSAIKTTAWIYLVYIILGIILSFIPQVLDYLFLVDVLRFIALALFAWFLVKKRYELEQAESIKVFVVWYAFDILLYWAVAFLLTFLPPL